MVIVNQVAGAVALEVTIYVPPERVFRALTSAEEIPNFFPQFPKVMFDARLDGICEFKGTNDDGSTYSARGRIIEIDSPTRLSYTWQWQEREFPETTVSFTLVPIEGGTRVSFLHSGFPAELEESRTEHESHWKDDLELLKRHAEAKL